MKLRFTSIIQATALLCVLIISALMIPGCAHLDKTGVYAGDQFLYQSELTTRTSYDLIHAYVTWEKDNRALLAKWPEIKKSADVMRAGAKTWFATAHAFHDVYAANPTDENQGNYARALEILQTALNEALHYMALAAAPKS